MPINSPPTDQRAGVRPIAFVLNNVGVLSAPVTLKVRPTDLTRTEPSRIAVHQTLGRDLQGWADNFGPGLPSVVIAGHTGWRASGTSGLDGAQAFEQLNNLIVNDYHDAKQLAIDIGIDPALVKLIFIDMLDNFCWSVAPGQFVLRRSKSQPLLYQYNLPMQAIATDIDNPLRIVPVLGDIQGGLSSLGGVIGTLAAIANKIKGWVASALALKDKILGPIAAAVSKFVNMARTVFAIVESTVSAIKNGIAGVANTLIGIASDIASVGVGIFRMISSIASLPGYLRSAISGVAGAFNEAFCIMKNSLRPRKTYNDYDGLYGASNCSSTTGGRGFSPYLNTNAFSLMLPDRGPIAVSSAAMSSMSTLNRGDPVLAPISFQEMGRHVDTINSGVDLSGGAPTTFAGTNAATA